MGSMTSIAYDLGFLRAGLEALETYLLSNGLYWTLRSSSPAGEGDYPSLTPGGLLLSLARLAAQTLPAAEAAEYAALRDQLNAARPGWRVAWEGKCAQDLRARLTQWRNFLEDLRENPEAQAGRLGYEIRLRLMQDLLLPEVGLEAGPAAEAISGLDAVLRGRSRSGPFLWPAALQAAFPVDRYWYLYRTLEKNQEE